MMEGFSQNLFSSPTRGPVKEYEGTPLKGTLSKSAEKNSSTDDSSILLNNSSMVQQEPLRNTPLVLSRSRGLMQRRYSLSDNKYSSYEEPTMLRNHSPHPARAAYNTHLKVHLESQSPGLASRIVQYSKEQQMQKLHKQRRNIPKYDGPGVFPVVHMHKENLPLLKNIKSKLSKSPLNLSMPDLTYYQSPPYASHIGKPKIDSGSEESQENGKDTVTANKSVLEALKEISRKRIHSNEEEIQLSSENTKRQKIKDTDNMKKRRRESDESSGYSYSSNNENVVNEITASRSSTMVIEVSKPVVKAKKKCKDADIPKLPKSASVVHAETQTVQVQQPKEEATRKPYVETVRVATEPVKFLRPQMKIIDDKPLEKLRMQRLALLMGHTKPEVTKEETKIDTATNNDDSPQTALKSILSNKVHEKTNLKHVTFNFTENDKVPEVSTSVPIPISETTSTTTPSKQAEPLTTITEKQIENAPIINTSSQTFDSNPIKLNTEPKKSETVEQKSEASKLDSGQSVSTMPKISFSTPISTFSFGSNLQTSVTSTAAPILNPFAAAKSVGDPRESNSGTLMKNSMIPNPIVTSSPVRPLALQNSSTSVTSTTPTFQFNQTPSTTPSVTSFAIASNPSLTSFSSANQNPSVTSFPSVANQNPSVTSFPSTANQNPLVTSFPNAANQNPSATSFAPSIAMPSVSTIADYNIPSGTMITSNDNNLIPKFKSNDSMMSNSQPDSSNDKKSPFALGNPFAPTSITNNISNGTNQIAATSSGMFNFGKQPMTTSSPQLQAKAPDFALKMSIATSASSKIESNTFVSPFAENTNAIRTFGVTTSHDSITKNVFSDAVNNPPRFASEEKPSSGFGVSKPNDSMFQSSGSFGQKDSTGFASSAVPNFNMNNSFNTPRTGGFSFGDVSNKPSFSAPNFLATTQPSSSDTNRQNMFGKFTTNANDSVATPKNMFGGSTGQMAAPFSDPKTTPFSDNKIASFSDSKAAPFADNKAVPFSDGNVFGKSTSTSFGTSSTGFGSTSTDFGSIKPQTPVFGTTMSSSTPAPAQAKPFGGLPTNPPSFSSNAFSVNTSAAPLFSFGSAQNPPQKSEVFSFGAAEAPRPVQFNFNSPNNNNMNNLNTSGVFGATAPPTNQFGDSQTAPGMFNIGSSGSSSMTPRSRTQLKGRRRTGI